jgi:hypothetical protein
VLTREEGRKLRLLRTRSEGLDGFGEVVADVLPFAGQLVEGPRVVEEAAQRADGGDPLAQPGALLLEDLRFLGIAPRLREAQFRLDGLELGLLPVDIKGTSGARRPFRRATRFER